MRYGAWWAAQWQPGISLGVHVELRTRVTNSGVRFGPYIDVHVGPLVLSIGRNPIYAGEVDLLQSYSRGGLKAEES